MSRQTITTHVQVTWERVTWIEGPGCIAFLSQCVVTVREPPPSHYSYYTICWCTLDTPSDLHIYTLATKDGWINSPPFPTFTLGNAYIVFLGLCLSLGAQNEFQWMWRWTSIESYHSHLESITRLSKQPHVALMFVFTSAGLSSECRVMPKAAALRERKAFTIIRFTQTCMWAALNKDSRNVLVTRGLST